MVGPWSGLQPPGAPLTATTAADPGFRAGFVALVGLTNVGKSTLLNALVGESLGIVTPKAQTTQRRLRGIFTDERHQAVFVDTPGLVEPRYALHRSMREDALAALHAADVAVAVVDVGFAPSIEWAAGFGPSIPGSKILCLNKRDVVTRDALEEACSRLAGPRAADAGWAGLYPTDAVKGEGIVELRAAALALLPESPPLYPAEDLSDAPVRELVAEMIREACLERLGQEVPYSVAVRVERFKERGGDRPTLIEATLFVERESQKGIVIGAGGRTIRDIGSRARSRIEGLLGRKAYLELRVKVLANWRKKPDKLRLLGFRVPSEES